MSDHFASIDREVPLTLFPVRLEARIKDGALRVRIYPDAIHADAHAGKMTEFERSAGYAYWSALWSVKEEDEALVTQQRDTLGGLVGARRALWVAEQTRPLDWGDFGNEEPTFPEPEVVNGAPPVMTGLLPDVWVYRVFDENMLEIAAGRCKNDVAKGLAMAPTLGGVEKDALLEEEVSADDEIDAFLKSQNLRWMSDFGAAIEAGMAFELKLEDDQRRFAAILVAGVRREQPALAAAEDVENHLLSHWFTSGVDVLPQGRPTNVTDLGATNQTEVLPDMDALFEQNAERRPLLSAGRAALLKREPAALLKMPGTDALSLALGLNFSNALDRVPEADSLDGLAGAVFNTFIGTALGQYFTNKVATEAGGAAPISGAWAQVARHHIDWVRAAGPIPTLRLGAMPYGVLPIQNRPSPESAPEADAEIISTILELFPNWTGARPLTTLDPEATDGNPDTDPVQAVTSLLEVLGAVPHPINLQLRSFQNYLDDDIAAIQAAFDAIEAIFADPDTEKGLGWEIPFDQFRARVTGVPNNNEPNAKAPALTDQAAEVAAFKDWLAAGWITPLRLDDVVGIVEDEIDPLIALYQEATADMPAILARHFGEGGISLAPPAVQKPEGLMNFVPSTWDENTVSVGTLVTLDGTLDALADWLVISIDALDDAPDKDKRETLIDDAAPLLHWIVDLAWLEINRGDANELAAALRLLLARIEPVLGLAVGDAALIAQVEELERLLREGLGLFMSRLDAWVTSFAAKRLAELRAERPRGLTIGGYGWLLDFRESLDPVSNGYIHAPSMNHAASAAVLRSGWEGYGTSDATKPLSVDLSSDRMRGATWCLAAVRNGQDIAELLGARFERYLHDDSMALDAYIDDVRAVVNAGRGLPRPEAQIANGLLIARAFSADRTVEEEAIRADLAAATSPIAGSSTAARKNRRVRAIFQKVADDLDAVADVAMAQTVHALAMGKEAQSASVLNMTGDQEGAVPEIDLPITPREALGVTHRIAVICPDGGAGHTVLQQAEPALAVWLAARLPRTGDVAFDAMMPNAAGRMRSLGQLRLSDLGLEPAELFALAGRGVTQAGTPLGRLLVAYAQHTFGDRLDRAQATITFDRASKGQMSVDDFGLAAGALRDALSRARPLRPEDVTAPGDKASAITDAANLDARLASVVASLETLADEVAQTAPGDDVTGLAARLAALNVGGAVSWAESATSDAAKEVVAAALADRIERLAASEEDSGARLAFAIGKALPILPLFDLDAGDPILASAGNTVLQESAARERSLWWRQIRKVSLGADMLGDALDLAAALRPDTVEVSGVAQLPDGADWAAITRPEGDTTTLAVFSGFDGVGAGPVSGFVADTVVESVPRPDHQTGLAFHFDAPSARAPQAILLSMLDDGDKEDVETQVFSQLLNTLDLMKTRAVGPDRVAGIGHIAPVTYLPEHVKIAEAET